MARFVVRYGVMRMVGVFSSRSEMLRRGTQVIARTTRGLEVGEVLCEATEQALAQLVDPPSGQILREMSPEDTNEANHLKSRERDEFEASQKHIATLKLNMQLVDVEHLFGGERIVVYYLSEERVDFRELVKVLASEFQTRIEMRQIGVRDEAKLLADYGDCGKPVCCNTHLVEMPPVSMKMAKLQKATLDPTKISGRCGRLKCCLRYEYDTYEDILKTLPPIGADVVTTTGRARILNHEILSQQLLVQTEDNRRLMIPATDVLSVIATAAHRARNERGDRERSQIDRGPADRAQADRGSSDQNLLGSDEGGGEQLESTGQESPDLSDASQPPGSPERGGPDDRRGEMRDRRGRDERRGAPPRPNQGSDRSRRENRGNDRPGGGGNNQGGGNNHGGRGPRDRSQAGDRRPRPERGPRVPQSEENLQSAAELPSDSSPPAIETRPIEEGSPATIERRAEAAPQESSSSNTSLPPAMQSESPTAGPSPNHLPSPTDASPDQEGRGDRET